MNFAYNEVPPQNVALQYRSNDTVDFVIAAVPGRVLMPNSVRLEGQISISTGGVGMALNQAINLSLLTGVHSCIDSVTTTTDALGVVENLQNYSRFAEMVRLASTSNQGLCDSEKSSELCTPQAYHQSALLAAGGSDFSLKPVFCLNRSDGPIPFTKSGAMRVSFRLARANIALYGGQVQPTTVFSLSDLRLRYLTMDDPSVTSAAMLVEASVTQAINSNSASITVSAPLLARGFTASGLYQADELNPAMNSNRCSPFGIQRLQIQYNDSDNKLISYMQDDQPSIRRFALESLRASTGTSALAQRNLTTTGMLIGQFFDKFQPLQDSRITMNILSDVDNPFNLTTFFHGVVQV